MHQTSKEHDIFTNFRHITTKTTSSIKATLDPAPIPTYINYGSKFVVLGYNSTYFSNKIQKGSPGPVACFSDEDDVSGIQNNCYWPLHIESIARCKHHMQEKLVYCCTYNVCEIKGSGLMNLLISYKLLKKLLLI
jgi:hypothetical protein